jgi:hypothetical protein
MEDDAHASRRHLGILLENLSWPMYDKKNLLKPGRFFGFIYTGDG